MVVVKQSACSPSTLTIQVWIQLMPTVFAWKERKYAKRGWGWPHKKDWSAMALSSIMPRPFKSHEFVNFEFVFFIDSFNGHWKTCKISHSAAKSCHYNRWQTVQFKLDAESLAAYLSKFQANLHFCKLKHLASTLISWNENIIHNKVSLLPVWPDV